MPLCKEAQNRKNEMKEKQTKKRKSGIPTGNAGEYFVMGELLRRGFDAQLADRNTKGYDLLVGSAEKATLRKIQVKTSRGGSWYVRQADFDTNADKKPHHQATIYVRLSSKKPVRYFIVRSRLLKRRDIYVPKGWTKYGILKMKALLRYEDKWKSLPT